jgi:hypothetical protein
MLFYNRYDKGVDLVASAYVLASGHRAESKNWNYGEDASQVDVSGMHPTNLRCDYILTDRPITKDGASGLGGSTLLQVIVKRREFRPAVCNLPS